MALVDKNIIITPNKSHATNDPQIVFSGADTSTSAQNITLKVYPYLGGTVSFEGSLGQLFSVSNNMTGTIFSVNDVSGMPSIEVLDTGNIKLAQYGGNVGINTSSPTVPLEINGNNTTGFRVTRYNTPGQYIAIDELDGSRHQIYTAGDKPFYINNNSATYGMDLMINAVSKLGISNAGAVTIPGTLTTTGNVTMSGTLKVKGLSTLSGSVTVIGTGSFNGKIEVASTTGADSNFWGGITVQNAKNLVGTGLLQITGNTTLSGTLRVKGLTSLSGGIVNTLKLNTATDATGQTNIILCNSTSMPQGIGEIRGIKTAAGGGYITFSTATGGTLTEKMRILETGGVSLTTGSFQTVSNEGLRINNDASYLAFHNTANTVRTGYIQFNAASTGVINVEVNQPLSIRTNSLERINIAAGGAVNITGRLIGGGNTTINGSADVSSIAYLGATAAGVAYPLTVANYAAAVNGNEARISFDFNGASWSTTSFIGSYIENATSAACGLTLGTYNGTTLSEKMRINAAGNVTMTGTLGVTGLITGTLATAAQTNITSLGTLTALSMGGTLNARDLYLTNYTGNSSYGLHFTSPVSYTNMIYYSDNAGTKPWAASATANASVVTGPAIRVSTTTGATNGFIIENDSSVLLEMQSSTGNTILNGNFNCTGNETTIRLNAQSITSNFTVPATSNGLTAGPITIASGITVTVTTGGTWTIV